VTEGAAADLLQRLASRYIPPGAPGALSPRMSEPPPGYLMHITVERIGGVGPWVAAAPER
jgi:hypothetical protein